MPQDLTGRRFGMLTVKEEVPPIKDARGVPLRRYNCQCDCGNEKIFNYCNLLSGKTNSCGCTRFPRKPPADFTGKKFGSLTVISEAERAANNKRRWNCLCDCGNTFTVFQYNLIKPDGTRSCRKCYHKKRDLTGNRYGRLTVISFYEKRHSKYMWKCLCDCGQETIVDESNLTNGHTGSCGCMAKTTMRGKKFGMLTVISGASRIKEMPFWNCRCECGNEIVVSRDDLFWGSVTNCGCQENPSWELAGQKFGRLTAIRPVHPIINSKGTPERAWLCRCECGREVVVRQGNLKNKVTRSCGCLRKDKARQRALARAHPAIQYTTTQQFSTQPYSNSVHR